MIEIFIKKFNLEENKIKSQNKAKESLFGLLGIKSNDIYKDSLGKPFLKDNRCYINISHSGNYISLAKSDSNVGIDIETIKNVFNPSRFIENTFSSNDLEMYIDPKDEDILRVHTIKESYLKFLGIGLVKDLNNVLIDYKNKTIKYKDYKVGYYYTEKICDILLTVTSDKEFTCSIKEV